MVRTMFNSFDVLTVLDGNGQIHSAGNDTPIARGQTTLLPAELSTYTITGDTPITVLITTVPTSVDTIVDRFRNEGLSDDAIRGLGGLLK